MSARLARTGDVALSYAVLTRGEPIPYPGQISWVLDGSASQVAEIDLAF
jgi:hypothetical protein